MQYDRDILKKLENVEFRGKQWFPNRHLKYLEIHVFHGVAPQYHETRVTQTRIQMCTSSNLLKILF
jgi:hypothetical protein